MWSWSSRSRAFKAAAEHDLSFYDQFSSGRIVSRITSDTNDFGQLVVIVTDLVSQVVPGRHPGGDSLPHRDGTWRSCCCSFIPFIFGITVGFRSLARRVTKPGMQAMADVNAAIKETVSGISVAKNFRQEKSIFQTFDAANQTSYRVNVQRGVVLSLVFPVLNALGGILMAILVYAGGHIAARGAISIGAWYLFIISLDQFFFPILNLSAFWAQIQPGLSAAERVFALIDADPNVVQTGHDPVPRLKGEVCFEHLDFRYTDKEPVLADFNLCIQPGENLALVGHTGAGKSSIAKLIARFYEFQHGRLTIDGLDIRTPRSDRLPPAVGHRLAGAFPLLRQRGRQYPLCRAQATEAEMLEMARQIGGGEWLEILPDGLHTEVGERGGASFHGAAPAGGPDARAGAASGHLHPG